MELRFLPEVEEDVMAGYDWYEDKALGLGEEFLRMFYAQARGLLNNPLMFPKVSGDFRRCLLRRFPYAVYFFIEDDHLIVVGLFHSARNPNTIHTNLRERGEGQNQES